MPPSSSEPANPFAHTPFRLYLLGRGFSELAYQIAAVGIGWQVYALTDSAFALGMVGLMQSIPTAVLIFLAGHVADRYDRKPIVQRCQIGAGLTAALLAWGTIAGWLTVPGIFVDVLLFGAAAAFESPAAAALLPGVVPEGMLQRGTAMSSGLFQVAATASRWCNWRHRTRSVVGWER